MLERVARENFSSFGENKYLISIVRQKYKEDRAICWRKNQMHRSFHHLMDFYNHLTSWSIENLIKSPLDLLIHQEMLFGDQLQPIIKDNYDQLNGSRNPKKLGEFAESQHQF